MTEHKPTVSIGLPVYNGENFLAAALDSILGQTFTDLELVITDNASEDGTEAICREYAAKDPRVRYHRNPENLGAAPNYNEAYHRSSGELFRWAAHDDLMEPTFLEVCVAALREHPEVVVAYTLFDMIDSDGKVVEAGESRPRLGSDMPHKRASAAIYPYNRGGASDSPIFGVMRRSALERTRLHGGYTGSDRTLLLELAVLGPYLEIPERLFQIREHPERSIKRYKVQAGHAREAWFDMKHAGKLVFPNWRRLGEFFRVILLAPLPFAERMRCLGVLGRWLTDNNWKRLVYDLRLGVKMIMDPRQRPS